MMLLQAIEVTTGFRAAMAAKTGQVCGAFLGDEADILEEQIEEVAVITDLAAADGSEIVFMRIEAGCEPFVAILSVYWVRRRLGALALAFSTCSTGKPGHETPTGVFVVLQKDRDHRSSTYNNAPMPNMNRLTWDGIALHAGNLPGYPASHGCVRLPLKFSSLLFDVTHLGTPVILAETHHFPVDVVHPGMVLSAYVESEFEDVVSTLEGRKHPADWTLDDAHPITSMIASSHDRKITIIENDVEVASGPLLWDGDPLGAHVYVLQGAHEGARGMHWQALTYGGSQNAEMQDLRRVRTDQAFVKQIRKHVHPGMVYVLTDLTLHPDSRSQCDFVIMS